MVEQSPAADYTIAYVYAADFPEQGNSLDGIREVAPAAIDAVLRPAFVESEIDWSACTVTGQGDRTLILLPSAATRLPLVDLLPNRLTAALRRYNAGEAEQPTRIGVLFHSGRSSTDGVVDFASRLLDVTRKAPAVWRSENVLDVVLTESFHRAAGDRHAPIERTAYHSVELPADSATTTVWARRADAADALLSWLDQLPATNPDVYRFLELCALLASSPISLGWFDGCGVDIPGHAELSGALADAVEHRLVDVNGSDGTVLVHPLVRAVLRDRMTEARRAETCVVVGRLLARLDPADPTVPRHWPRYQRLLPHASTPCVVESADPNARALVVNTARYLYLRGEQGAAARLAERAWMAWGHTDEDDPRSVELASYRGLFLWALGRFAEAADVNRRTLTVTRRVAGDEARETIRAQLRVAVDLRTRGEFTAARDQNVAIHEETGRLFAEDDPITLQTAHDLAVVSRLCGQYRYALDLDLDTCRRRAASLGSHSSDTLLTRSGIDLDRQGLGEFEKACIGHAEVAELLVDLVGEQAPGTLLRQSLLAVALRGAGDHGGALDLTRRTWAALGRVYAADHPATLACAVGYATDLRYAGQFDEARAVGERARAGYRRALGENHPLTLAADANAAVTIRLLGDAASARQLNEVTLTRFHATVGAQHPHAIACAVNLASDAAELGDVDTAVEVGNQAAERAERAETAIGPAHPVLLAARLNLVLDEATRGVDITDAHARIVDLYQRKLGAEHPSTVSARARTRINCDIDPLPM